MEGNRMKMREALELAIEVGDWCCAQTDDPLECCEFSCIYQVEPHGEAGADCPWKKIRAALAAPSRNCDRFEDETDAQIAFLNEVWLISVTKETALDRDRFENWTDEMRSGYAKWLLATAAERKGGDSR